MLDSFTLLGRSDAWVWISKDWPCRTRYMSNVKGRELPTHKTPTITRSPQAFLAGQGWAHSSKHEPYLPSPPLCPLRNQLLMKRKGREGDAQIDLMSSLLSYVLICWGILLVCFCVFVVGVCWITNTSISHGLIFIKVAFMSVPIALWTARWHTAPLRYERPEFISQLKNLSQSHPPISLPLRFLSALICPIIIKK